MSKLERPGLLGDKILSALTEKEIIQLLENLFQFATKDMVEQVLEHFNPNTKETLERILTPQ